MDNFINTSSCSKTVDKNSEILYSRNMVVFICHMTNSSGYQQRFHTSSIFSLIGSKRSVNGFLFVHEKPLPIFPLCISFAFRSKFSYVTCLANVCPYGHTSNYPRWVDMQQIMGIKPIGLSIWGMPFNVLFPRGPRMFLMLTGCALW